MIANYKKDAHCVFALEKEKRTTAATLLEAAFNQLVCSF